MKKWVIAILIVLLFIVSAMAGFIVRSFINFSKGDKKENNIVLAEEKIDKIVDASSKEVTVSPNAEVVLTEYFQKCGHTKTWKEIAPREIVNLNREKVEEFYKDWNVDEFSANQIRLSRTNKGICDEHYMIRESNGYISISIKNDIGECIFKGLTDIPVQYLTEEDIAKLEKGIEVVGKENLNKFLEDFE